MADDNPNGPSQGTLGLGAVDRLDSWKQIAGYLNRGVRTLQRWETQGLPVHPIEHERADTVFALKSELHVWLLNGGHGRDGVAP